MGRQEHLLGDADPHRGLGKIRAQAWAEVDGVGRARLRRRLLEGREVRVPGRVRSHQDPLGARSCHQGVLRQTVSGRPAPGCPQLIVLRHLFEVPEAILAQIIGQSNSKPLRECFYYKAPNDS